jgi:hypothetical protein
VRFILSLLYFLSLLFLFSLSLLYPSSILSSLLLSLSVSRLLFSLLFSLSLSLSLCLAIYLLSFDFSIIYLSIINRVYWGITALAFLGKKPLNLDTRPDGSSNEEGDTLTTNSPQNQINAHKVIEYILSCLHTFTVPASSTPFTSSTGSTSNTASTQDDKNISSKGDDEEQVRAQAFGGHTGHDPHLLYTLSAIQVLATLNALDHPSLDRTLLSNCTSRPSSFLTLLHLLTSNRKYVM